LTLAEECNPGHAAQTRRIGMRLERALSQGTALAQLTHSVEEKIIQMVDEEKQYPPAVFTRRNIHMKTKLGLLVSGTTLAAVISVLVGGCSKPADETGMPPPSTTVGTEIDDSVVTTRVKSALLADPEIKSFDFKVETRKGEVQLSGFVDNQAQIDRATTVIRGVAGVKNIENKLSLKGEATTVGNKVDDGIITSKVKAALLADVNIKSLDIAVETRKGEVQLSGFVDNQSQIERAIETARGIEGVRNVRNEMSIKK
jgi:hyperosmotically inducible protein